MDLEIFKCPWCDYSNENLENSLRIHVQKKHKKSSKELYDSLYGTTTCLCGCGMETKYHGLLNGYSKYRWGHISRINNNWGHNLDALEKSQETRRQMFARGEIIPWKTGLTKETDPRLAACGKKQSESVRANPILLQKMADRMRNMRLDGTIPTVYGKDASRWKGGVSSLQCLSRSYLSKTWTFQKLKEANFQCSICESKKNLNVHHDQERFADIVRAIAIKHDYLGSKDSFEKKTLISLEVVQYHIENNTSGIVLCHECHKKLHEQLGETFNIKIK